MILSLQTHRKFTYKKNAIILHDKLWNPTCAMFILAIFWQYIDQQQLFPIIISLLKQDLSIDFIFFNQRNPKPFLFFLLYNKKYIHCNDIVILTFCPSLRLVLSLKYFFINLSELYLGRCWFYPAEQKRGTTARRSSHVQQERFKNNLNHYNSHAFVFDTSKLLKKNFG